MKTSKTLALAFFGALALASCKKETVEMTTTDQIVGDTTITTTKTATSVESTVDIEANEAKAKWEKAKEDLKAAIANGDKKAQEAAQKTADEAETAWNKIKADFKENTAEAKQDLNEVKEKAKEEYNEALEKAKVK